MNDVKNELPDKAARAVLVWQMARIRADLAFALGWKRTQAKAWEQLCRKEGVRLKPPHPDNFTTHLN